MRPALLAHTTSAASVTPTSGGGWLLTIPGGPAGQYRLAQLDDYARLPRRRFPARPPLTLSLRARASAASLPGTWGFGLWNDPFGLGLGFGGSPWKVPSLPNVIWFFHAGPSNYLSLREDKPAQGFLAQTFRAAGFHPLVLAVALVWPFSRRVARRWLRHVVEEDAVALDVDVTQWHSYRLEWGARRGAFWVDEALVLETPLSPPPPLGLVIWIDNQFAAFAPDGKLRWGVLENPQAWIEIEGLDVRQE